MQTGAGIVTAQGLEMWGTSQVAISIALAKAGVSVRILDADHNIPLHLLDSLDRLPSRVAHLHYHWLFEDDATLSLDRVLPLAPPQREWLRERLPLSGKMVATAQNV
jgi:hypothetical protein